MRCTPISLEDVGLFFAKGAWKWTYLLAKEGAYVMFSRLCLHLHLHFFPLIIVIVQCEQYHRNQWCPFVGNIANAPGQCERRISLYTVINRFITSQVEEEEEEAEVEEDEDEEYSESIVKKRKGRPPKPNKVMVKPVAGKVRLFHYLYEINC